MMLRRRIFIGIGIFLAILLLVLVSLSFLGAAIANVFSNITMNLMHANFVSPPPIASFATGIPVPLPASPTGVPADENDATRIAQTALIGATAAFAETQAAPGIEPDEDELTLAAQFTATASEVDDLRVTAQAVITQTSGFSPESPPEMIDAFCGDNVCLPDEIGMCAADCVGETYTPVPLLTPTPRGGGGSTSLIGSSSLYVFHDKTVRPKQQTVVELKLFFDAVFITATPTSARTAIPVTQAAPRPVVDSAATSTPRSAVYSESEFEVPDQLIAILDCGSAFVGCGAKPVLPLSITRPNEWLWQIMPSADVQGKQTLTLQLWTVGENNTARFQLWSYNFAIEVVSASVSDDVPSASPMPLVLIITGMAGLALFGGIVFASRQPPTKKKIGVALDNAPKVFISYRRSASAGYGQILHDKLSERGAEIFLDVRDLHAGEFSENLKESIATCDYFLLLLAPTTLESDWVVKEVEYAREKGKIIIPVLINDFNLYGDDMPANLTWLQQQNAIPIPHLFVDAAIEKIATFIGLPESS